MGLFFYTKIGSIIFIGDLPTTNIIEPFYVQAHNAQQYSNMYDTQETVSVPHCLYVHFEDSPEYLQFAYSKLELHMYENDIQTDGTVYTVYVNSSPEKMIVDIFRPAISL